MMFDLFKFKLSTKYMKGIAAKFVSKRIYKKLGIKVNIQFDEFEMNTIDGDIVIHIAADGRINKAEFERLLESLD